MDNAAAAVIKMFDGVTLKHLIDQPNSLNKPLCDARATQDITVHGTLRVRNGVSATN